MKSEIMLWSQYAKMRGFSEEERKIVLRHVPYIVGKIKSILDFGCSTCTLLDLFPSNIEKVGVEIDARARAVCISKGYKVFESIDECPVVECITMVDVLEHLEPEYFVQELIPKLKDKLVSGGKLYIQTYNPYCVFALVDFYNDFTHKFMWTLDSLIAVLRMYGFKVVKAGYLFPLHSSKRIINLFMRFFTKLFDKKHLYMEEFVLAEKP